MSRVCLRYEHFKLGQVSMVRLETRMRVAT
jgi:hypothetical protein